MYIFLKTRMIAYMHMVLLFLNDIFGILIFSTSVGFLVFFALLLRGREPSSIAFHS